MRPGSSPQTGRKLFNIFGCGHLTHSKERFVSWFIKQSLSMAAVQAEGVRASYMFVGDLNGHHQESLGSTTTNRHGVAAFDFATVSGYDQLVVGPAHARGGTLDLLMTDVPDLAWVAVVASIGKSDHSSLSAVISMAQAVPNVCVSRKVFLKLQVNWNTVCGAIQELSWRNIWLSDNPVEVSNEHLSLLVGRYVPTKVIHVRNKDKPWFDDQCRHAFGLKQELAHLRWTQCSVSRGLFVWVVSRLAGDRPMSPQFRKVHCPLLLPITDRFP